MKNYHSGKRNNTHAVDFNFSISDAYAEQQSESEYGSVIVIGSGEPEHQETFYCPKCEARGIYEPLGNIILREGQIPGSQSNNKKQCHSCYTIVPLHELRHEGQLYSDYELISNAYDTGERIETITYRRPRKGKTLKDEVDREFEDRKAGIPKKDKEVLREIDKGNIISGYTTV